MRQPSFHCLLALTVLVGVAACERPQSPASPLSESETKQIDERVQAYFRKTVSLPAGVTMRLAELKPAAVPGLLDATLEVSSGPRVQKVSLTLTRDGRFMAQGALVDLTADPFKVTMEKINLKDLPVRGDAAAPVTIVEYSDFQCPFCSRAYSMLEDQLLKDYAGKVKLVFKNFPLVNLHPWAQPAAMASVCARQQKPEAFWAVYDFLFRNQQSITAENLKEKIQGALREKGFDADAFAACFDSQGGMAAVTADMQEGTALGIRSTPTFFINGRRVDGAQPYEQFKRLTDEALGLKSPEPAQPEAGAAPAAQGLPPGHPAPGKMPPGAGAPAQPNLPAGHPPVPDAGAQSSN